MLMETELTIRVQKEWVEKAKDYAARHDTTVTQLVSDYLRYVSAQGEMLTDTPILERLSGILPTDVMVEEHREYLERKYGR